MTPTIARTMREAGDRILTGDQTKQPTKMKHKEFEAEFQPVKWEDSNIDNPYFHPFYDLKEGQQQGPPVRWNGGSVKSAPVQVRGLGLCFLSDDGQGFRWFPLFQHHNPYRGTGTKWSGEHWTPIRMVAAKMPFAHRFNFHSQNTY